MKWTDLSKKQQQNVILGLLVAAIVGAGLFYGLKAMGGKEGGPRPKEELRDLQAKIAEAKRLLQSAGQARQDMTRSVEQVEALARLAPSSSDRYAWAYEYVSRCAAQAGLKVNSLDEMAAQVEEPAKDAKKGAAKKPSEPPPYEVSVATLAGWNQLVEFLLQLEKDNPLLRVSEVKITAGEQSELHEIRLVLQWPAALKISRGTP